MNKTAKHTIILMAATLISKLLGFAREIALAYKYGAGMVSDAYVIAFSIPTVIFAGLGSAILTCYVPMYTRLQEDKPRELRQFNNNITTVVVLLSAVVLGGFWLFDDAIVRLFAVGFEGEALAFTSTLARVMMVSVVFIGVSNILQGYLQIKDSFYAVGLVSVPLNIFVVASILLSGEANTAVLSTGLVAGYGATLVMLLVTALRKGFRYRPALSLRDSNIRRMTTLVLPIFLGRTIMQINIMIDRTLASTLPEGTVSALNYANKIFGFVMSVFVVSVTTASFHKLARYSARRDLGRLKATTVSNMGMVTLLILPISMGAIVLSGPIVRLLLGRGAFDSNAELLTSQALAYYCTGLLFYSLKDILNNVFYAMQETKIPTVNSVLTVALNVALNLALIKPLAHVGLALATSISSGVTMLLLLSSLRKKIGPMGLKRYFISLLKMLIAGGAMIAAVVPVYNWLIDLEIGGKTGQLLPLLAAVLAGMLVYFTVLVLLRTRELGELVLGLHRTLNRRKAR